VAKVNLFEFSDLLFCATRIGFGWNQAHDFLVKDDVPPMHGFNKTEFYKRECTESNNPYGYSPDTLKVLQAFFEEEKIDDFVMIA
jgi:hypothetical protein